LSPLPKSILTNIRKGFHRVTASQNAALNWPQNLRTTRKWSATEEKPDANYQQPEIDGQEKDETREHGQLSCHNPAASRRQRTLHPDFAEKAVHHPSQSERLNRR